MLDGSNAARTLRTLMSSRRSCRAFLPAQLDRPTIELILEMAQRTASWCNTQPWQVIITAGAETERFRAGLMQAASDHAAALELDAPAYAGTYLERRRDVGWQLYDAVGIGRGDREASRHQALENFRLFGAPHVAIVTTERALGSYGTMDCGGFVQNFLLVAESLGVASIAQAAIASQSSFVRKHFNIGDTRTILCGISFGYADKAHPANSFSTRRAAMDEIVSWWGSE